MQDEFSRLLKYARKDAHLTQKQLAALLGVATGTVQQWELGLRFPRPEMLAKIADALQVPVYELMGYSLKHDTPENRAIADAGLRAAFGKGGAADVSEWVPVSFEQLHAEQQAFLDSRMKKAFSALNETGQKVACERVEELAEMPKYKRTDAVQSGGGIVSPPDEKKPPEGLKTPSDGNNESPDESPTVARQVT